VRDKQPRQTAGSHKTEQPITACLTRSREAREEQPGKNKTEQPAAGGSRDLPTTPNGQAGDAKAAKEQPRTAGKAEQPSNPQMIRQMIRQILRTLTGIPIAWKGFFIKIPPGISS